MKNPTYSQKVEDWLLKQSGCSLKDYCIKFKYYPLALKIISLDEYDEKKSKMTIARDKELKELYMAYNNDKYAISRRGNNRSWTQYFKDLITGWILEDLVIEMLRHYGIETLHNGRDARRVIAIGNNVTQDADLIVKVGDVCRKVELSNELNTILENEGFIEKRAPALVKLWQDKGIWVYRDISRGKYVLIDFGTEKVTLHLRNHNTVKKNFTKDVHRYVLAENRKMERDDRLLVPELISVVGCSIDGKEQPELNEIEDQDSPPHVFTKGGKFKKNNEDNGMREQNRVDVVVEKTKNPGMEENLGKTSKTEIEEQSDESITDEETEGEEINMENQDDMGYGDSDFV